MTRRSFSLCVAGIFINAIAYAHGGDEILAQNPQLSSIPDWPKRSSNTGSVSVPIDCNKCALAASLENMRRMGETAYRCVSYEGRSGGKAWESGGGAYSRFQLQLHPNSPIVWRVFPDGGYEGDARANQIAEFDTKGKMIFSKSALSPHVQVSREIRDASTDCPRGRPYHGDAVAGTPVGSPPENGKTPTNPQQDAQKAVTDAATKALKGLLGR